MFVQLGNLLEAEGTILPPPRTAGVLAGVFQAGGSFEERDFISTWVLVESRAWSQVLEDFAVLLPLSRRRFRARRAVAWPTVPWALPAGSKGRADGLHCERESVQGADSRETLSARERGRARLLSDSREMLLAELWGWPTGGGGAGLVVRVVWDRGGCRAWLVGTSARPWPSSSGMEWFPELGEG